MSILTKQIEIVKTKEQIKTEALVTIARETKEFYELLVRRYNNVMNMFWNHPKLTPQEVSDALGTDAYSIFQYGGALSTLITTVKPDETRLVLPKNAFTISQDGTVTILDTPYVPS